MNGDGEWGRVSSILHIFLTQNFVFDEPFVGRTKEFSVCFEETVAAFVLFPYTAPLSTFFELYMMNVEAFYKRFRIPGNEVNSNNNRQKKTNNTKLISAKMGLAYYTLLYFHKIYSILTINNTI